jgi:hypothetical protein
VNDDKISMSSLPGRAGDPNYRRILSSREEGGMHVLRGETGGPRDCLNSGQSHGPAAQEEGLIYGWIILFATRFVQKGSTLNGKL